MLTDVWYISELTISNIFSILSCTFGENNADMSNWGYLLLGYRHAWCSNHENCYPEKVIYISVQERKLQLSSFSCSFAHFFRGILEWDILVYRPNTNQFVTWPLQKQAWQTCDQLYYKKSRSNCSIYHLYHQDHPYVSFCEDHLLSTYKLYSETCKCYFTYVLIQCHPQTYIFI